MLFNNLVFLFSHITFWNYSQNKFTLIILFLFLHSCVQGVRLHTLHTPWLHLWQVYYYWFSIKPTSGIINFIKIDNKLILAESISKFCDQIYVALHRYRIRIIVIIRRFGNFKPKVTKSHTCHIFRKEADFSDFRLYRSIRVGVNGNFILGDDRNPV